MEPKEHAGSVPRHSSPHARPAELAGCPPCLFCTHVAQVDADECLWVALAGSRVALALADEVAEGAVGVIDLGDQCGGKHAQRGGRGDRQRKGSRGSCGGSGGGSILRHNWQRGAREGKASLCGVDIAS